MKPETGQAPSSASDTGAGQPTRPGSRTTATAGEHGTSGPRAAGRRSTATDHRSGGTDEMDPETRKAIEESRRQQNDMVRNRIKDKYDLQIAAMVNRLGLDADQE